MTMSEHHVCFCGPCSARVEALESQLKDAVMLLRRCLNSGRETAISMDIRSKTLDWIVRNGLAGSILRTDRS